MKQHFTVSAFADEISKDLDEQIRVLKANGISHLELRGIDGKNVSDFTPEEAQAYALRLDAAGIGVSSIGSPIGKIQITDDFAPHLEKFQHTLDIARIFHAPYVRMFSFFIPEGDDPDDYRDDVVARWQEFLRVAKDYPELTLLHENEKAIYGDIPRRCLELMKALDDPQVRVAFDPANFVQCNAQVFPEGYEDLRPYIAYLHVKDARYQDHEVRPAGLGDGRVPDVIKALSDSDFTGFASIEPHLSMFEGFSKLEADNASQLKVSDNVRQFNVAAGAFGRILADLDEAWQ